MIADSDGLLGCFTRWHESNPTCNGWGLAWYLAGELVSRFHVSHGHRVEVLQHEGLGYYGIAVVAPSCPGSKGEAIGRFTMHGDVESWVTGSAGDHGLGLVRQVAGGVSAEEVVPQAVRHLGLSTHPSPTHRSCKHRHRGGSYVLICNLAARMALRHEGSVDVRSALDLERAERSDPQPLPHTTNHPGYLALSCGGHEVHLRGDGRLIAGGASESLWERYVADASVPAILAEVETRLGIGPVPMTGDHPRPV